MFFLSATSIYGSNSMTFLGIHSTKFVSHQRIGANMLKWSKPIRPCHGLGCDFMIGVELTPLPTNFADTDGGLN